MRWVCSHLASYQGGGPHLIGCPWLLHYFRSYLTYLKVVVFQNQTTRRGIKRKLQVCGFKRGEVSWRFLGAVEKLRRTIISLMLCVSCIILWYVNGQRDAEFIIINFYSTVFCLLYMFRTKLVVHHQEHCIMHCITQFGINRAGESSCLEVQLQGS